MALSKSLLVALILLAGCLGQPGTTPPVGTSAAGQVVPASHASRSGAWTWSDVLAYAVPDDGSGSAADGYVLDGRVAPGGALTGFSWKLPQGALVHSKQLDRDMVFIELVPMVEGQVRLNATLAGLFAVKGGQAVATDVQAQFGGWVNITSQGRNNAYAFEPSLGTQQLLFEDPATTDVRLVIGGTGPAQDIKWLLLIHHSTPFDGDHNVTRSPQQALTLLTGHKLHQLHQTGSGVGLFGGSYARIEWPWANLSLEMQAGQATYEHTSGPTGNVRRYSVAVDVASGWSAGQGFEDSDADIGYWTVDGTAQGLVLRDVSALAHDADSTRNALLSFTGYSIYSFVADGKGPTKEVFEVHATGAPKEYFRSFQEVSFGTTLTDLLGVPGETHYAGYGTASRWLQVNPVPLPLL